MIWQEIVENGQQKPLAFPALLVSLEEVITAAATVSRVVAAAAIRRVATASFPSAHFYTCNAES